ncbi:N-acetylneuraminate synthase family protein [bacterium]|nr:N-acetylneuraminate synthase family protein [bacterium]
MKQIRIAGRTIGPDTPCFIIAEAGVNHNGRLDLALRLVDEAAAAGADAVKFQTYRTEELILADIEKAPYQQRTTDRREKQEEMLRILEIDEAFHRELIRHCEKKEIMFLSTPYDTASLELLVRLNVPAIKIASTDTTNLLFLEEVAAAGKPVILSTGMSTLEEIDQAVRCLRQGGCRELALLKCTSDYPTRPEEVNLAAMDRLEELFDAVTGFSDHTAGIGASPYAAARGARIIEKHFTLDKQLPGPDHQASLSPEELRELVRRVREVELFLGSRDIGPTAAEKVNRLSLQKHLVAAVSLTPGTELTRSHLKAKRTGGAGVPAGDLYRVLGKRVTAGIEADRPIDWDNLE